VTRLPRPCPGPGGGVDCGALVTPPTTRCRSCERRYQAGRGSVNERLGAGWAAISRRVIARDEGVCYFCGRDGANSAHHLLARRDGGDSSLSNLVAAHVGCHSGWNRAA